MHHLTSEILHPRGVENFDCGSVRSKGFEAANEIPRGRHGEMCCQRGAIGPLLDEHQAERILAIDMHGVREAAWFEARATYVLQTQSADLIERIVSCGHASRHEDHRSSPVVIVSRDSSRQFTCACKLDRLLRP